MHIISASRRTDIPHYYADWFRARRAAGFAEYRTVFGGGKAGYFRASLKPEDVLGYLFWTKFAGPFHGELDALRREGVPFAFQYTVNGYGPGIEPGVPPRDEVIADLLAAADLLPAPDCLQWRYDPLLVSDRTFTPDWHRENFRAIAARLAGRTRVVNASVAEPYEKALSKAPAGRAFAWRRAPGLRAGLWSRRPGLRAAGAAEAELLRDLQAIARGYGMELRVCCNPEYAGRFPAAQCCGRELFAPYGAAVDLQAAALKAAPSRAGCRCLKSLDIGMDDTCPAGCFYCYVTSSFDAARGNFGRHDPACPHLR